MKYAAEMGSGAMIYMYTLFDKDSTTHSGVDGEGHTHADIETHRQDGDVAIAVRFMLTSCISISSILKVEAI
jgi:hypothetical protein